MASIDERVVSMAFENGAFERGVAQTLGTLHKLDAAIKNMSTQNLANGLGNIESASHKVTLDAPVSALGRLKGALGKVGSGASAGFNFIERAASKVSLTGPLTALDKVRSAFGKGVSKEAADSFADVEKASDKVELSGIARAVEGIAGKFTMLQGVATVALGNISSQAVMRGGAFAKSFAFGPLQQGFEEYQTNLGSIQTILANTQGQQVSGLGEVNKHLTELNHYSDQTIYNFSEMAKNIGTFTAAGVDLDTSTQSIKGIANLAALSGSNSQQASTAMYQLSQAIAAGRVGLQDWNSVVNAGMGGAVFQKALMRTAENMGALKDGAVEIDKATGKATVNGTSFRESIMAKPGEQSWLSSDVLTKTLGQFTGDLDKAELAAQGFSAEQIKAIQQTAKSAQNAATEVKTLPQAFDVARETIGSGWSQSFQLIFGNFNQSKKTFTDFSRTLNGFINDASNARNKVLGEWNKLGGRTVFIEGIKNAFHALMNILGPLHDAFRDIFPATTGKELFNITVAFRDFTKTIRDFLILHSSELENTFRGLFAVLHIGVSIVKGIFGVIGDLLGVVGEGSGGFLGFTSSVGNFLVGLDKAITSGKSMGAIFAGLTDALKVPIRLLRTVGGLLRNLFTGADIPTIGGKTSSALDLISESLGPLSPLFDKAVSALKAFRDALSDVAHFLEPIFSSAIDTITGFADKVKTVLGSISFDDVMQGAATAGIGGIFLTLKKAIGGGVDVKFFDGVKEEVVGTLNAVNGSLSALQKNIQANTLLQIGIAISALAVGVMILSKIDARDLGKAMTAVAVGLGELVGAVRLLGEAGGAVSLAVMPLVGAALIELAIAVTILSFAVKQFAALSWEDLVKGLVGVGGALLAISQGTKAMPKSLILVGPALIPIAIALNIMAVAMKVFATLSWEDMAKGLVGIGLGLTAIGEATSLMGPQLRIIGPALIPIGVGLLLMSTAIGILGNMDIMTLAKGILAMAEAMQILGRAMLIMPKSMIAQAAGLTLVGFALIEIGIALGIIGSLKITTLIKSIVGIASALAVLSVGLALMTGSIAGAAALTLAAAGLAVLTPVLVTMGNLAWGTILKGLAAIVLSIGALSLVSIAAGPALLILGAGLSALGLGLLAIGTAVYVAAKGISLLSTTGQAGISVLLVAITGFVAILPKIIIEFVKGLGEIIGAIAELAPKVAIALGVVIDSLLSTIIEAAPKLAIAAGSLIDAFLVIVVEKAPKLIEAGWNLLVAFLKGINDHIGDVVHNAGQIIGKFLGQLSLEAPKIIAAGARFLKAYLNGIADHLPEVIAAAARVVVTFLTEVGNHVEEMVHAGGRVVVKFLKGIGDKVGDIVAAGYRILIQFLKGIEQHFPEVVLQAHRTIRAFLRAIGDEDQMRKTVRTGINAAINFLNGISAGLEDGKKIAELADAGIRLGKAVAKGFLRGLRDLADEIQEEVIGFSLTKDYSAADKAADAQLDADLARIHRDAEKKKSAQDRGMKGVGRAAGDGYVKGMVEKSPEVEQATRQAVRRAIKGARQEAGVRSPSTVFIEIGNYIVDGMAIGLQDFAVTLDKGVVNPLKLLVRHNGDMKAMGKFLGGAFLDGLDGELKEAPQGRAGVIEGAFQGLKDKFKEQQDKLREDIQKDRDKLAKEMDKKHPSQKAIEAIMRDLNGNIRLLNASKEAMSGLMDELKDEKAALLALSSTYDSLTAQLEAAQSKLDGLVADRQNKFESLKGQYSTLPELGDDSEDQLKKYKESLRKQIDATKKFMDTLKALRDLGLDDATYEKLVDQGTNAQGFAEQLLKSGKSGITELNKLDADLAANAHNLAANAANTLYQAGIDAAQGLVDGLKKNKDAIQAQMDELGASMVAGIKRALGIKSPSRVLAEVGRFAADGVIAGLKGSTRAVADTAAGLGDDAASALTNSLSHISAAVGSEIDTDVTITPVLDLTQVQKDAKFLRSDLRSFENVIPISAAASYGQATAISEEQAVTADSQAATEAAAVQQFHFEQNNYSPEALSDIEIYRQTNNQLAQVKNALGLTPA